MLTKTQLKALKVVRRKLHVKLVEGNCTVFNPTFKSANPCCVKDRADVERKMQCYLNSWVLPIIEALIEEDTKTVRFMIRGEPT